MIPNFPPHFCVIGTDTDVGKTYVTRWLAQQLRTTRRVITQKWVQTGCTAAIPADIQAHGIAPLGDTRRYPYHFAYPASPHLAARLAGKQVDPAYIHQCFRSLAHDYDTVICEGAGGLFVPLTDDYLLLHCIQDLNLPSVLVVANKLGCINHAMLTLDALRSRNLALHAIIMNRIDTTQDIVLTDENTRIIRHLSQVPVISL